MARFGGNTSVLAELAMRSPKNIYFGRHSTPRALPLVLSEILRMMELDDPAQPLQFISAMHRPITSEAGNAATRKKKEGDPAKSACGKKSAGSVGNVNANS
jgi:hypothetical protein